MKSIILVLLSVLSISFVYGQTNQTKDIAIEKLLIENKTHEITQQMMLGLIKQSVSKKPNAPKSMVNEIQNSLDYVGYYEDVKLAYSKEYSEAEIKELTQLHKDGKMELYKQKSERVAKALYDIGSDFGRKSMKIIQTKLLPY